MKHVSLSIMLRLVIIVFLGFVLVNESVAIFQFRNEAASLSAEADSLAGTDLQTINLRAIKTDDLPDVTRLDATAITKAQLADFISLIEAAGKSEGATVSISSITSTVAATGTPQTVHVSTQESGSWAANFGFLHLIENLPYKVSVDESRLTLVNKVWQSDVALTLTLVQ